MIELKPFEITYTERMQKTLLIHSESFHKATQIAAELYARGAVILNSDRHALRREGELPSISTAIISKETSPDLYAKLIADNHITPVAIEALTEIEQKFGPFVVPTPPQ